MDDKNIYNEFLSFLIKHIREAEKLTQKSFGEKIEKSEISIRKYESGKINIPFTTFFIIVKIFNISIIKMKQLLNLVLLEFAYKEGRKQSEIDFCLEAFAKDLTKIYKVPIKQENLLKTYASSDLINVFEEELHEYIKLRIYSISNFDIMDFYKDDIQELIESTINIVNHKINILIKKIRD